MLEIDLKNNIEVIEPLLETCKDSSIEQQLLYNLALQSILGNIVRFHAVEEKDRIVIEVEYDDFNKTIKTEFSVGNKELFYEFFKEL